MGWKEITRKCRPRWTIVVTFVCLSKSGSFEIFWSFVSEVVCPWEIWFQRSLWYQMFSWYFILHKSLRLLADFWKLFLNIWGKHTIWKSAFDILQILTPFSCRTLSLSPRIKFNGEMTKRQFSSFWHFALKQHSRALALLQFLISQRPSIFHFEDTNETLSSHSNECIRNNCGSKLCVVSSCFSFLFLLVDKWRLDSRVHRVEVKR